MKIVNQRDTLIIIPVFNEEKNIAHVIDSITDNFQEADILVVNDGSFDGTAALLKEKGVFALTHLANMGIGASFETGCQYALRYNYSYVVRMDGDGQHDPLFLKDLLFPLKSGESDIVIGSRFLSDVGFKSSFFRRIGITIISFFLAAITKKKVTDPTSGFCAMNKKAYEFFSRNCVEDYPEPEILMCHRNFRIKEVPIAMAKRGGGASSITTWKSIYYMYKVLFSLLVSMFRKEAE